MLIPKRQINQELVQSYWLQAVQISNYSLSNSNKHQGAVLKKQQQF